MDNAAALEPEEERDTSMWAWPREMLGHVLAAGEDFTGLNRRVATLVSRWLWAAEAVVRRLLLAAALALDMAPPKAKPAKAASPQPAPDNPAAEKSGKPASREAERSIPFRVFAVRHSAQGRGAATEPTAAPAAPATPASRTNTVGILQRDPLLRLGAELARRRPSRSRVRTRRRARPISHLDPLYVHNDSDEENRLWAIYGPYKRDRPGYREPGAGQDPMFDKRSPWHVHFTPRRDPLEDKTLYPAPMLALRAKALMRILQAPDAAALRLARALSRLDIGSFENAGIPIYTRRHADRAPEPPGRLEIEDARCTLREALERRRPPDTS